MRPHHGGGGGFHLRHVGGLVGVRHSGDVTDDHLRIRFLDQGALHDASIFQGDIDP